MHRKKNNFRRCQACSKKIANKLLAGWSFNTDKHGIHTAIKKKNHFTIGCFIHKQPNFMYNQPCSSTDMLKMLTAF